MSLPWARLHLRKQHRSGGKPKPLTLVGFDSETNPAENKTRLLCFENGDSFNPDSFGTILEAFFQKKFRGISFVCYNLQFEVQAALKWLHPDFWKSLWKDGELELEPGLKLELIPWKLFRIKDKKKKHTVSWFDICQFYNYLSLDVAAKAYLGRGKLDFDRMGITDFTDPKAIEYCIEDARLAGDLARLLVSIHEKYFPGNPVSLISKASMSEKNFSRAVSIPTVNNLIVQYPLFLRYGYESYKGGFFETFKKGYFEKVWCYDINSAYPFEIAHLPDLSGGRFVFERRRIPAAAYRGYLRAWVSVHPKQDAAYYSPLSLDVKGLRFYPSGAFKTFLTLAEYREYEKVFDLKPIDGVYWIPDREPVFLFAEEIRRLYEWKANEKDPVLKSLIKIILNSFYGKMIQKTPNRKTGLYDTGNLFNPFWAADITAGCRLKLFRALQRSGRGPLVMVATDSLTVTKPLDFDLNNELGKWSLEKLGEAVVIGTGVYTIKGEKTVSRVRGFKPTGRIDFLDLDSIEGISTKLKIQIKKHISLAEALIQKKPSEMNLIKTEFRELDLNFDFRRFWLDKFRNLKDLRTKQIDSVPLPAEMLC